MIRPRYPVVRHCTIDGKPGVCWWREAGDGGMLDCSITGERTVSGEPRHDLWHAERVVLLGRLYPTH